MTRQDWLKNQHSKLHKQVEDLETEREHTRSAEHKALLQYLKKEKLRIKTELELSTLTTDIAE